MFGLFKRKAEKNIVSPVDGKCIDISEVKDKTFANKLLGDGLAILPSGAVVRSPADGEISMLFPTRHAFGIRKKDGTEILVHIGIDTVELNGKGFHAYLNVKDKVRAGDKVISFNEDYLTRENLDMTVMVILTSSEKKYVKNHVGENVKAGDRLFTYETDQED